MTARKRRKDSEYKPRYAKKLREGLRIDGLSIQEVAYEFGISVTTYYNWRRTIPEFDAACEIGDRDQAIWWHKLTRDAAMGTIKANAGIICFAMKNIESGAWVDKREIHTTSDEEVRVIKIEVLPSQQMPVNYIEAENVKRIENLPDEEPD